MKAAGALGLPLGLRDNIALIYLLATKRKRLPHDTQRQPVGATKVFGGRGGPGGCSNNPVEAIAFRSMALIPSGRHVASMSHGVAGSDWESLKRKENCCDKLQHGGG